MNLMVRETFTIELTMTSDWHIGSGTSKGDIDSIVQRDADGLPYIPAKTLTGILRDSCELVALGLDNGKHGIWQQWVDCLFGSQPALETSAIEPPPRPAALSIRSAHLLRDLTKALIAKPKVKKAISFIKPSAKIDPDSGCTEKECLRFEEMIRKNTILQSEKCRLTLPPETTKETKQTAYALLLAGAKMVERLGGKRRRGAGRCKITIESESNLKPWLEWLSKLKNPPSPPEFKELDDFKPNNSAGATDASWYSLKLEITTKTPVIINARTIGNVVETLDYIPGKYLLRILHKKLGQWLDINDAIANSNCIVTNATVTIDKNQGRATPFSLFAEKVNGGLDKGNVYNRLVEREPDGIQLKGIRGGYVGRFNNTHLPSYQKIDLSVYTHNTIQDEFQRPTDQVGGVYSYEAIPSGITFQAELRLKKTLFDRLNKNDAKQYKEKLNGEYSIGQSKKDDYGLIQLNILGQPTDLSKTTQNIDDSTKILYVWLLSDVLLRDTRLRPTANLEEFRRQLETALGVELKVIEDENLISIMARQHRTDSWQVRWGLPRPSLVGLAAGSCMIYQVTGTLDPSRINQILAQGIGERRAEGYGQLCFNDPLLTSKMSQLNASTRQQQNKSSNDFILNKNNKGFDYARIIETSAWREEIKRSCIAIASNATKRQQLLGITIENKESQPPMSQLGALKSVIFRLQTQDDSSSVSSWINSVLDVPSRKDKWPNGSLEKIKNLINNSSLIWNEIKISNDLTLTQNAQQELKNTLWAEAIRTLIDACIRAHKREWEKENLRG